MTNYIRDLLARCEKYGIDLRATPDGIEYDGPVGPLPDALKEELQHSIREVWWALKERENVAA